jgi:hypothetical protein
MAIREMFNAYQKNNLSAGQKDIKGINQEIIYDHMPVGTNMSEKYSHRIGFTL